MGRRSTSLLKGRASAQEAFDALLVNAPAAPRQDDQPSAWTILLTSTGLLRWRSIRPLPESEPKRGDKHTTTSQVLLGAPRLGVGLLYDERGKLRDDESPAPLSPDEIEARDDLDFYLDRCRREREQEAAYHREWIPRLRRLGLVKSRLGGLPTGDGKPCQCPTCRGVPSDSSPWRPPVPSKSL